jgi:hypothetical protein
MEDVEIQDWALKDVSLLGVASLGEPVEEIAFVALQKDGSSSMNTMGDLRSNNFVNDSLENYEANPYEPAASKNLFGVNHSLLPTLSVIAT